MALPSSTQTATLGGEQLLVASHGHDAISVAVDDPVFGRISTVRLDIDQADLLARTLQAHLDARR
jgi:hypothetical protein